MKAQQVTADTKQAFDFVYETQFPERPKFAQTTREQYLPFFLAGIEFEKKQQAAELKQLRDKNAVQADLIATEIGTFAENNRLKSELEKLRADHEISESARTALYEDLQALQKKYGKLRAEQERVINLLNDYNFHDELGAVIVDNRGDATPAVIKLLKSKLTDSAQSGEEVLYEESISAV